MRTSVKSGLLDALGRPWRQTLRLANWDTIFKARIRGNAFAISLLGLLSTTALFPSTSLAAGVQISGGYSHTLALKPDGSLWAWGDNTAGRLGDNSTTSSTTPIPITSGTSYKSVSAGLNQSFAFRTGDGVLMAWGNNTYGQLGTGDTTEQHIPIPVQTVDGTNFSAVSAGHYHTLALKSGSIWGWGRNDYGQVGNNSASDQLLPTKLSVAGITFMSVAAGGQHSLALDSNGGLWAWGRNTFGQLGIAVGDTTNRSQPTPLTSAGTGFTAIYAGDRFSIAFKATDGSLWAWGYNGNGELGLGDTIDRQTPQLVAGKYIAIVAGGNHVLALKTDGTLWAWGDNSAGQLGINSSTTANLASPTQIGTDHYGLIGAGYSSSYAAKLDGTLFVWGSNTYGQLGLGDAINRYSPTALNGFSVALPPDTTSPSVPIDLAATTTGANQVNLTWTAATDNVGVTAYNVYRDGGTTPFTTLGNVTSYSDTGLTAGTTYSYTVVACDAAGNCSVQSTAASATTGAAPDTLAPTIPAALTATASGASQINLAWTAATDNIGVTAYQVYRDGVLIATLGNVTSYSDTGLTAGTTYSYTVAACDAAGNCSLQSTAAPATTAAATAALSGLTVSCPATVASGQTGSCTANASYSSGPSKTVTPTWSTVLGAAATISATGTITASTVTVDTAVVINASYVENGVTKSATATVTITAATNTPPPSSTNACTGTAKNTAAITVAGGQFKLVGDSLDVQYCLRNFSKSSRFDIYVALQLPDGELLYLQSAGFFGTPIFTATMAPYLSNTLVPDMSGSVLSVTDLPLELPTGTYTFYAIPVLAGKSVTNAFNWIGQLSQGSFTLGK